MNNTEGVCNCITHAGHSSGWICPVHGVIGVEHEAAYDLQRDLLNKIDEMLSGGSA